MKKAKILAGGVAAYLQGVAKKFVGSGHRRCVTSPPPSIFISCNNPAALQKNGSSKRGQKYCQSSTSILVAPAYTTQASAFSTLRPVPSAHQRNPVPAKREAMNFGCRPPPTKKPQRYSRSIGAKQFSGLHYDGISTDSARSVSTKMRPQFSQTITFLRCLISLCFWGGMKLKQPPQASRSTGTTAKPLR